VKLHQNPVGLFYFFVQGFTQVIARGVLDSRDVIYFLSVIFISLYGAHLAMQEKE